MFYPFLQQKPALQIAPSPTPAPHILYNPTQHMLTYPNFCLSGQALPAYPNYPVSMQVGAEAKTKSEIQGDALATECTFLPTSTLVSKQLVMEVN